MNIRWLLIGALLCGPQAWADSKSPESALPQVEVNAQREKLTVIRAEMVKLERRFFAEYNKLNTDHQYDVACDWEAATGTLIKTPVCRPVFVSNATEVESQASLRGDPAPPASMIIMAKMQDYEKNLLDVTNKHAELRKLVHEHEALGKRYEAVQKAKFKGKPFAFE